MHDLFRHVFRREKNEKALESNSRKKKGSNRMRPLRETPSGWLGFKETPKKCSFGHKTTEKWKEKRGGEIIIRNFSSRLISLQK